MAATPGIAPTKPPLAGYADWRGRWGWMLYDWASQPYHTLITTFVFAPYFASAVAPNPVVGQEMWGWANTAGGLTIALAAPFLGAMADATGPRKPWLALCSALYVVGAWLLWYATPGDPNPALVLAAFVIGLIGVEFATVFNNSMMPLIVPRARLGALSGDGWALGYIGGVVALAIMLLFFAEDAETGTTMLGIAPVLGLDPEAREGTRAVGPITAVWYAVFIIPLFLFTPDAPRRAAMKGSVRAGLAMLREALRDLKGRPSLTWFLGASMLYRDALNGFYVFGGIYAVGVLGWSITEVGVFGVVAATIGAAGALLGGRADLRLGPKPVAMGCVIFLIFGALLGVSVSRTDVLFLVPVAPESSLPDILFYVVGAIIGAAGGALQAVSRNLVVRLAEPERVAASFGLYALVGKATAFLAPALIALATGLSENQRIGVSPVIALFVLGMLMLLMVRDETAAASETR